MSLVGRPSTHRDVMPVAIIVFLLCMGGLAYANMKKSEGKKDKAVGEKLCIALARPSCGQMGRCAGNRRRGGRGVIQSGAGSRK